MRRTLAILLMFVAGCRADPEAARKALASPDPTDRDRASTTLKALYAENPASLGDHGEDYWITRLDAAKGKKTPEAIGVLDGAKVHGGEAGGGGESFTVDLDDFWMASLGRSTRGDDVVFSVGRPQRRVAHVDVGAPDGFTGTWTTYYVHGTVYETVELQGGVRQRVRRFHDGGQLWTEVSFVDGKLDGVVVTRSADGTVEREETWSSGRQRFEKSYYPSGKTESETTYEDGTVARQRSFLETGEVRSCEVFRKGSPEPCLD